MLQPLAHCCAAVVLSIAALAATTAYAAEPSAGLPELTSKRLFDAQARAIEALAADTPYAEVLAAAVADLGPPAPAHVEGRSAWAVIDADRCLRFSLHPELREPGLESTQRAVPTSYHSCLDTARRDPQGTAAAAAAAQAAAQAASPPPPTPARGDGTRVWVLVGLGGFAVLTFGVVIWSFYARRQVWARFAAAHGLEATGLGPNEEPRIRGRYRGVMIEVGLGAVGQLRLRGKGTFTLSDTRASALIEPPLAPGLWMTSPDLGAADRGREALGPPGTPLEAVVTRFLSSAHQGYVDSEEVSASVPAMPRSVGALQALVDRCVEVAAAAAATATRTTG